MNNIINTSYLVNNMDRSHTKFRNSERISSQEKRIAARPIKKMINVVMFKMLKFSY